MAALNAAFSPDGTALVTSHSRGIGMVWDVTTGTLRSELPTGQHDLWGVAFSPDGKTIATGGIDNAICLWDATTGHSKGKPIPVRGQVWALAWLPDSQTLLVGNSQGALQFWDATTGLRGPYALTHQNTVFAVAATATAARSPRAAAIKRCACGTPNQSNSSATACRTALCCDLSASALMAARWRPPVPTASCVSGELRRIEMQHPTRVYAGVFSPGGRTILTGCGDHMARLWDAATGKPSGEPFEHVNGVQGVAFRSNGRTFVTGCANGEVWTWNIGRKEPGGVIRASGRRECPGV